jgi:hypothetical protein
MQSQKSYILVVRYYMDKIIKSKTLVEKVDCASFVQAVEERIVNCNAPDAGGIALVSVFPNPDHWKWLFHNLMKQLDGCRK